MILYTYGLIVIGHILFGMGTVVGGAWYHNEPLFSSPQERREFFTAIVATILFSIIFPIFYLLLIYFKSKISIRIQFYFDIKPLILKYRFDIFEYTRSKKFFHIEKLIEDIKNLESYKEFGEDYKFSYQNNLCSFIIFIEKQEKSRVSIIEK